MTQDMFQAIRASACALISMALVVDIAEAHPAQTSGPTIPQARLLPSNLGGDFGSVVAVYGDTAVVSAPSDRSNATGVNGNAADISLIGAGAAFVYVRNGTTWSLQAYLKASNTDSNDFFGTSVAIFEDTIVVGAAGEASGATGIDGNQFDNGLPDSGAAYVFTRSGNSWTQQAYLKPSNTPYALYFGSSVALSGDTLVVGASSEVSNAVGVNGNQYDASAGGSGAAYVFRRNGTTWVQEAYLKASNTGISDHFGGSVAIDGDSIVIGAQGEDSNATGIDGDGLNNLAAAAGSAYVFHLGGAGWAQQAYLKASNTGTSDRFGWSVAIIGDTIAVGASEESSGSQGVNGNQSDNSAPSAGAAYVFIRSSGTWSQQAYLKATNAQTADRFGYSCAMSADRIIIGANWEASSATGVDGNQADNSSNYSGAAYSFVHVGGAWQQEHYLKGNPVHTLDQFGYSVAIDHETVLAGSRMVWGGTGSADAFLLDSITSPFCTGEVGGTPCPCTNQGSTGNGCGNSTEASGASLRSTGVAYLSMDTLEIRTNGVPDGPGIYFQGTTALGAASSVAFGDGLLCLSGTVVRFPVQFASGGQVAYPAGIPAAPPVSVWGAVPSAGVTRCYQWWYRDAMNYCTAATFNLSNGLSVVWRP